MLRRGIFLDLFAQPLQPPEEPRAWDVGRQRFACAPHKKAEPILAREPRTALCARRASNAPALQRMHVLEGVTFIEEENHRGHPPRSHPTSDRALDQSLDVRRRI